VSKVVKVVIWVVVFSACIAAGAVTASRTDPFPPGVEDPGARPTNTPKPTATAPAPTTWDLAMDVTTRHTLHVGGSCRSAWRIMGSITVRPNGRAAGDANAKLDGRAQCDFPQSQVQTQAIRMVVVGSTEHGKLQLGFSEAGRTPAGSQDLGGLPNTLSLIDPAVRLGPATRTANASVKASRPDGDLGMYSSTSHLRLSVQ
jgi:hypothetical protein